MKKLLCLFFTALLLAGLFVSPLTVAAAGGAPIPNDDIEMGDVILRANYEKKAAEAFEEEDLDDFDFYYRLVDSEVFSETYVELGAIWDRDYLYLAYELQEGYPDAEITLNGVQVTDAEVKETETHVLVKIPLASANVYVAAYGNTYSMEIKLDDLYWEGDVMFTVEQKSMFNYSTGKDEYTHEDYYRVKEGNSVYMESQADYVGQWPNPYPNAVFTNQEILISGTTPTVVEFDFQSPMVPVDNSASGIEGIQIAITDETGGSTEKRHAIVLFITSGTDGDINLVAHHNKGRYGTGIANDSNAKIHFRMEIYNQDAWCESATEFNNCGMRVYVNGMLVLEQEDVKTSNGGITIGAKCLAFGGHMDGENPFEVNISNIEIYHEMPMDAKTGSIDSVEMSHLLGDNTDENSITSDMNLIKYLPDGQINGTAITWSSSDEAIIDKTGKVTAPAVDTLVELKATVHSTGESKTFQVMVKKAAPVIIPGVVDGEDMTWIYIAAGAAAAVIVVVVIIIVAVSKSKKKKRAVEE